MKAFLTSVILLTMMQFSSAQLTTTVYDYVDGQGNNFQLNGLFLNYTYVQSGTYAVYSGTTAKTVELTKQEAETLNRLISACLAAKDDQIASRTAGASTLKYKKFSKDMKTHLKIDAASRVALEKQLKEYISR